MNKPKIQCYQRKQKIKASDMPEFYMPAMWPVDLQNAIVDWLSAWRWRRQMRKLLRQDAQGLVRLGSTRATVAQGAGESLKVIAARKSRLRRERAKP
ncbi:hypothetical protein [Pseudomonas sp. EA_35y_Pfl2_R5]|uniref:hypothetical protein n=1 Tax=Pseudomonas sp. EA_35y_Pfl2_R5 TaxID=3088690 RepID=UPI0030D86A5F